MNERNKQLTPDEHRLLQEANQPSQPKLNLTLLGLSLGAGVLAGGLFMGYGVVQLLGVVSHQGDALQAIAVGGLLVAYSLSRHQHLRFKRQALSLIRKLT